MLTLQETLDAFIRSADDHHASDLQVEQCMEALSAYLLHCSDLFDDQEISDEGEYAEWEKQLESHMRELLQGDIEMTGDLGNLPLSALDAEHLRDFLGWFLLRESGDAELIQIASDALRDWIAFLLSRGWLSHAEALQFEGILDEVTPAAVRTARLAHVLFHFVRSAAGVPAELRGVTFSDFVEGNGRVTKISDEGLYLDFDNRESSVGPLALPQKIMELVGIGDVFDVEIGLRRNCWVMVDIGPIYPRSVYIEAEEFQGLNKIS